MMVNFDVQDGFTTTLSALASRFDAVMFSGGLEAPSYRGDPTGETEVPDPCAPVVVTYSIEYPRATPAVAVNNDNSPLELGTAFTVSESGRVTKLMFYRGDSSNVGPHTLKLWRVSDATILASKVVSPLTASGWQIVDLTPPVDVGVGIEYLVSYNVPAGRYSTTNQYFASPVIRGSLTGIMGRYNTTPGNLPASTFQNTFYWVDIVVEIGDSGGEVGPLVPTEGQIWPRGF